MIKNLVHSLLVCPSWETEYPKLIRGSGVYLYDDKGKRYLDGTSCSAAVSNIGHGNIEIAEVLYRQAQKLAISPTHAFSSDVVEDYLDKLIAFSPKGFSRAWTISSGTEAVENSLKLALQYHQILGKKNKYKIVSRWLSYHGNSVFTLDVGGMKLRRQNYENWMHNFPHLPPVYQYRHPEQMTEDEYCEYCITQFIECIEKNDPETIAAYIAEPVVGAALGAAVPPKNYFRRINKICEQYDILFISDEVMTGFGRLGANFGIEKFDTLPNIIAAGKGISGGYFPLSAVIADEKISEVFESSGALFGAGHTYSCSPLAASVGSYIIDFYKKNNILENVNQMSELFFKRLHEKIAPLDIVGDVRGNGLLIGVELVKDKETKAAFSNDLQISREVCAEAVQDGVILYPCKGSIEGLYGDHIMITPPLIINEEHITEIVDVLGSTLSKISQKYI